MRRAGPEQNVTYTVINSQNKKESISLLKDVGGYILPGEMTALMGWAPAPLCRAAAPTFTARAAGACLS